MKKQTRRTFLQTSAAALALATAAPGQKQASSENSSDKSDQPKKDGALEIAVLLFDKMTALDAVGPYEVLHRLPNATIKFVGETKGLKLTDSKMLSLAADYTLDEVSRPDVLLIPGGDVRVPVGSKKVIDWILTAHKTTKYTVSVCTGSLILGAAELLRGKRRRRGGQPKKCLLIRSGRNTSLKGMCKWAKSSRRRACPPGLMPDYS